MRTSFELKTIATSFDQAVLESRKLVCSFLNISDSELDDKVSLELKVQLPKSETAEDIAAAVADGKFVVMIYGSVKQSVVKPFGL